MQKNNFNKRANTSLNELPMRVTDEVLNLCRQNVEPKWKYLIRKVLNKYLQKKMKITVLGEGCQLGKSSKINSLSIGNYASFGPHCEFNGPLIIGDLSMLSSEVLLVGQDHDGTDITKPMRIAYPKKERPITVIEADCWIGARVTIMEGVRIGRGSIIGAASVVTKSIPPYSIAVGVPAKVIKMRFTDQEIQSYDNFLYGKGLE